VSTIHRLSRSEEPGKKARKKDNKNKEIDGKVRTTKDQITTVACQIEQRQTGLCLFCIS